MVIFIFKEKEKESQVPSDQDFAYGEVERIDKIFMADKGNNKVLLTKEQGYWMVNDKYPVMPVKINTLLETISRMRVINYVSRPKWDQVIRELATTSTKIELYKDEEKKPFKVFHVGGDAFRSQGTYMIMEVDGKVAEKPYLINLPGFVGVLSVRFFTDENDWRDTKIFHYDLDDIKEVEINYPDEEENSFILTVFDRDSFSITSPLKDTQDARNLYKPGVIKYLSDFDFLNAESYANEYEKKDSILGTTPYVNVSVTDYSGTTQKISVFYMPLTKRSKLQFDPYGNQIPYDLDRFYALIHDSREFVVIQDFVFDKIFRKYDDFFVKENSEI